MKLNKKWCKFLKVTLTSLLGILSLIEIIWLSSYLSSQNKNINKNLEINNESSNQINKSISEQKDFTLSSDNTINTKILEGNEYQFQPLYTRDDSLTTGPRGFLSVNSITSTLDYIGYDGTLLWQYKENGTIATGFDYLKDTLIDSIYYEKAGVFVIAKMTNVDFYQSFFSFQFITIRESTGELVAKSSNIRFYRGGTENGVNTWEWYKNLFMNQVKGEENCIVMWNQSYGIDSGNLHFARVWILPNGNIDQQDDNVHRLTRNDGNTSNFSIVAAKTILVDDINWTITVNLYQDTGKYYLTIYRNWNFECEKELGNSSLDNARLQKAINNIHVYLWSDCRTLEYTFIDNLNSNESSIKSGYFDTTLQKVNEANIVEKNLSLNDNKTINVDVYSGDIHGDYAYFYGYDDSMNYFNNKKIEYLEYI